MENPKSKWVSGLEALLRYATPLGAITAFLVGIYHYQDTKREEFKKEFWERRYEVYNHLTDVTASIANTPDSVSFDSLCREFWIIFWGKSILIEDREVYESMRDFGTSIDRAVLPDSVFILREKALHVSNSCRQSLRSTWEPVPLKSGVRATEYD